MPKSFLIILHFLFAYCEGVAVHQRIPRAASPLDEPSLHSEAKSSLTLQNAFALYAKSAECNGMCVKPLLETIQLALNADNRTHGINEICSKYDEAVACTKWKAHCKIYEAFDITTSGIKYMCVDQKEAFSSLAYCIETNLPSVRTECYKMCNPNAVASGIALQNTLKVMSFMEIVDPLVPRLVAAETCRIIKCMLECSKKKFNVRCEGSAGSLLQETAVLPFSRAQRSFLTLPVVGALAVFLPPQCSFLSSERILKSYRIDPRLNEELKRMYSVRMHQQLPDSPVLSETGEEFQPWQLPKDFQNEVKSPLENGHSVFPRKLRSWNPVSNANVTDAFSQEFSFKVVKMPL